MMLSDLRGKLGVENNEYEMMSDFKKRVLDIAIDQINEHTDITVNYEQHKAGRVITGFTFSLKQKKQPKDVTPKAKPKPKSSKSTDYSEIDALLKNNEWVSQHAQTGESWEDARARLRREAATGKFSLAPT